MVSTGFVPLVLALAGCAPAQHPLLAEIFYDAVGDDEGLEFVELYNPSAAPADLEGLRIEAGDGAGAGRWTLRWTAPAGARIAPGARYVVGGAGVSPSPDAVASLLLQNGPDAVRLVWPDGALEVVGYGALAYPEYACGRPAADVASGQSLARMPDAADFGENALDFRAAAPSPGRANLLRRHVAWVPGTLELAPERPEAGATARLAGHIVNAGSDTLASGTIALRVSIRRGAELEERASATVPPAIAPGETLGVSVEVVSPEAGVHTWIARLELPGDESSQGTTDSLRARVGPAPFVLTEIQFHPRRGEGEWVEIANRSGARAELEGFTLHDRSGSRGAPATPVSCDAESLVVFAQDREALLAAYTRLDPARIVAVHPWPSLNNSDDALGVADVLELRDAEGLPCDRVAYSARGIPAGVPTERGPDGRWRAALDPEGSPSRPPREPASIPGAFWLAPRRLGAGERTARIAWSLPWPAATLRVEAYDLSGGHLATPLGDTDVSARGERELPLDRLGPGLRVLVLRAREAAGPGSLEATQLLRIVSGAR